MVIHRLFSKKAFFSAKTAYLSGFIFFIATLFFLMSTLSVSAADCDKNPSQLNFFSLFNPLVSFAEKTLKSFGYDIALAIAPDPDTCGSDTYVSAANPSGNPCSGGVPSPVTISWTPFPAPACGFVEYLGGYTCEYHICRYGIGVRDHQTSELVVNAFTALNTTYNISSGLTNNTTYDWVANVFFYYPSGGGVPIWPNTAQGNCNDSFYQPSAYLLGYTDLPHGSFTTANCAYTYSWQTGSWGSCSSCSQTRSVWCQRNDGATVDDSYCNGGKPATSQSCGLVNGGWSAWSNTDSCGTYQSCKQRQDRTCTNPSPACGGATCSGDSIQYLDCGAVNGGWSAWSNWTPVCPACGDVTQTRTRNLHKAGSTMRRRELFGGVKRIAILRSSTLCH